MVCVICNHNLIHCRCQDIDARLANLRKSPYLYVDNIIVQRVRAGLSKPESFPDLFKIEGGDTAA